MPKTSVIEIMATDKKIQAKYGALGRRKSGGYTLQTETSDILPSKLLKPPQPQNGRTNVSPLSLSPTGSHNDLTQSEEDFSGISFRADDMENFRPVAIEEELQSRVFELNGLLRQWQRRAHQYKSQVTSLSTQVQNMREESAHHIHSIQNEHQLLIQNIRSELNGVMAAKAKIEQDYCTLQASFKSSLEQNKSDMENWHKRWRQRTGDMENLRTVNTTMQKEIVELRKQITALRKENDHLKLRNKEIKQDLKVSKLQQRAGVEKSETKKCSCMAADYKMLFEMTLLKLQTYEKKHHPVTSYNIGAISDKEQALLDSAVDLARLAGGDIEITTIDQSDSTDSCDSPRSPTVKHKSLVNLSHADNLLPQHSPKVSSRCPQRKSVDSPPIKQKHNGIGHEVFYDPEFRERAFSEMTSNRRKHPLSKGYSTDDPRVLHVASHSFEELSINRRDTPSPRHMTDIKDTEHQRHSSDSVVDTAHGEIGTSATSGFGGLRSRRNGITDMPLDVSVALRFQDVKKSKEFSHLLSKFTKDKSDQHHHEQKFSAIRRLSRKKSKPSVKD